MKRKEAILSIASAIMLCLLTTMSYSQPEGYQNLYIDDFRYGLFVPPDYNPDVSHHLLMWLHGSGYTADDVHRQYHQDWQDRYPTIVLTPKCTS